MSEALPVAPQVLPSVLTIGVFDGVHRGHQDLVKRMLADARARGTRAVCVTFDPDPELVLRPDTPVRALSSIEQRKQLLLDLGVDEVHVVQFSHDVSQLSAEQFVDHLRARFDVRAVWVGSNFAMGHDRSGTVDTLHAIGRRCAFDVNAVEPLEYEGRRISSSWIRDALQQGHVELVEQLLGHQYCLDGEVVTGMQRGRQLGFPTANVVPPTGRALPSDGVYFVEARITHAGTPYDQAQPDAAPAESHYGVVNLGPRPTFDESERLIETHLLDFSGDLYGTRMDVCFLRQLRGIQKFPSFEALREQIDRDVATARALVAEAAHRP